jgi:hypothetical protein
MTLSIGTSVLLLLLLGAPQRPYPPERTGPAGAEGRPDVLLPSGKSQRQEILKADFAKTKADAAQLLDLAQQLKQELDRDDHNVLDLRAMKNAEEIEKLAKRIKDRMKQHL